MVNIAVFASGSGTNAAALADYFADHSEARVNLIVTNNPSAGVVVRALKRDIPVVILEPGELESEEFFQELKRREIDLILLAGFLKLIPQKLLNLFPERIINIHPALLPDFGGKGMYGKRVHKAVSASGKNESGISIHLVNEEYDKGRILQQFKVKIDPGEAPDSIESKVRSLELQHYGSVVDRFIRKLP
ncbi:MAG: phosphoribosylglycinamide formyltransferase [Saprospirales bacterium]|nr:MAG: phosphoribosylglycinamide formyltransferase [Saprospirales bacterium]